MLKKFLSIALIAVFAATAVTALPENIETEGEPVLGEEDAEVTIVVFEDFQCPFCKRFEENAFPQIKSNYVETGEVKVVWKDRPLPQLHPWAEGAAAAMECVYREGGNQAFWDTKNKIFSNQADISTSNVESQIKSWAAEEGVSESEVQSCLGDDNPMEEVNADSTEGENAGASGTPTVFVDDQKIVGAQPYSNFESAIETELGGGEEVADEESGESSTDPEDLQERLNDTSDSDEDVNVTALQERVEEQQSQIEDLKEDQSTILNILETIMSMLGL